MRCAQRTAIAAVYGFAICTAGTVLAQSVQALAPEPQPATAVYASTAAPREKAVSPEPAVTESREQKIARLRETAFGRTGNGQFREPSAETREAARQALFLLGDDGRPLPYKPAASAVVGAAVVSPGNVVTTANQLADYRAMGEASTSDAGPSNISNGKQRPASAHAPETPLMAMAVGQVQPPSPIQPPSPVQPPSPNEPGAVNTNFDPFAAPSEQFIREASAAPSVQAATNAQITQGGNPDLASALAASPATQNVEVQRRSDITFDPHVRGYRWGQLYPDVDGAYWMTARPDMDSMLSKIDPGMIDNIVVIPGPYGVRYGPDFSFIDVNLVPTPRPDTIQSQFDTSMTVNGNGSQINGRETISGCGSDWGYRGSYGERDGNDYLAGNFEKMPSEYHAHDAWGQVGYDINPHQKVDFAYNFLEMDNTQIPGQFFNIAQMTTNGFGVKVVDDDPTAPWARLTVGGWYNETGFTGNTAGNNGPNFPVTQRINFALDQEFGSSGIYDPTNQYLLSGFTNGYEFSSGARVGLEFGQKDELQFRTGADFRYLGQTINETFSIDQVGGSGTGVGPFGTGDSTSDPFTTNMPLSHMVDPGMYAELSFPVTDRWTILLGGRVDYVHTDTLASDLRLDPLTGQYIGSLVGLNSDLSNLNILQRSDVLPAFYLTNRFQLGDHWTLSGGFGEAERPPTLLERYADGIFLATMQTGFAHVGGDPQLNPERDWQFDVSLSSNYDNWRSRGSFFCAWVQDYITYIGQPVVGLPNTFALLYTNTPMASLAGFEISEEYDLNQNYTLFANMSYTEGTDESLGGPLPNMTPLASLVGLRIHDGDKGRHWGIENSVQIVARQTRLGEIYSVTGTPETIETPTAAFAVWNIHSYYNYSKNLSFTAGINNVTNTNYQTALDIRYAAVGPYPALHVWEPGFSPYVGVNWKF